MTDQGLTSLPSLVKVLSHCLDSGHLPDSFQILKNLFGSPPRQTDSRRATLCNTTIKISRRVAILLVETIPVANVRLVDRWTPVRDRVPTHVFTSGGNHCNSWRAARHRQSSVLALQQQADTCFSGCFELHADMSAQHSTTEYLLDYVMAEVLTSFFGGEQASAFLFFPARVQIWRAG